ncbi:phage tail tape measure protein, partial [Escherichia coli]|uniref:phage tail tape measure protein n=1 Tax=Escherichia coli TaxID=562 RepID=UPI0013DEFE06
MAEPVGDLVVDLSLDAARFDEQMARVRRHFSGTESDAKKTAAVVEQSLRGIPTSPVSRWCSVPVS